MAQEPILNNINKHITIDEEEASFFQNLLKEITVNKRDVLLRSGQLCRHIYFVNSGILRAYFVDKEGKEATIMFAVKDWWVTDMHCFINQLPAMLFIEAIEQSNILQLSKNDMEELLVTIPKFERFFRNLMQNAYIREQLRVIQNLSLTAEERYHNFVSKYPDVARQVTQKQIASYLGITPEFLSTMRANKNKR